MTDVRKHTLTGRAARLIADFASDRSGATAIEYGLIGVLISVAIIPALIGYRGQFQATYNVLTNAMSTAMR